MDRGLQGRFAAGTWRGAERSFWSDGFPARVRRRPSPAAGELAQAHQPARVFRRDRRYRRLLILADVLATTLALALCASLLGHEGRLGTLVVAGLPLVVAIAKVLGLYDRDELVLHRSTLEEGPTLFQLSTLFCLLLFVAGEPLGIGEPDRMTILGVWATMFLGLVLARVLAREVARVTTEPDRCMLLGDPQVCKHVRNKIAKAPHVNAAVVCEVLSERIGEVELPVAKLARLAAEHRVERVLLAPRSTDHADVLNLVRAIESLGLTVSVVPRLLEVVGSAMVVDELDGLRILGVQRFGLTRSSRLVKRAMDVCAAGLGLLLLAPLMAAIAVAIRVTSPGPVLFRQLRVGRSDTVFTMLKFRTMVQDAEQRKASLAHLNEAPGLFKITNDPRVTRVGRALRATSLDELPQLWNVLKGEMSLVGPRPLIIEDDSHIEGWDRRRLDLTPGMTGPWQVLGSSRIPLAEMVKLDYAYVGTWSLWGDVKILVRTVAMVGIRRNM
jgi:exopolysaccharide biosynthesis polyprenyl glycosylphosphotransferase